MTTKQGTLFKRTTISKASRKAISNLVGSLNFGALISKITISLSKVAI
jgi:hypothetical protein